MKPLLLFCLYTFFALPNSAAQSSQPLKCKDQNVACANVNAGSAILLFEMSKVKSMLPENLEIVPQLLYSTQGLHPVVLMFGQHSRYSVNLNGGAPELKDNYNEFIFVVPFVREKGVRSDRVYWYFPKLYLNQDFPIEAGRPYGFNKFKEDIAVEFSGRHISRMRVGNKIDIELEKDGGLFQLLAMGGPAVLTQTQIIHLPVIGFLPDGQKRCSQFEWSYTKSWLTPARIKFTLAEDALPGIEAGVYQVGGVGSSMHYVANGGVFMRSRWHIGFPQPCD